MERGREWRFDLLRTEQEEEEKSWYHHLFSKKGELKDKRKAVKMVLDNPRDPNHINNLKIYKKMGKKLRKEISLLKAKEKAGWPGVMSEETTLPAPPSTQNMEESQGAEETTQSTVAGEKRCIKWLIELMNDSIANNESKPTRTKKQYQADAQKEFGVSINGFNRAWSQAITETNATKWSAPGRKS